MAHKIRGKGEGSISQRPNGNWRAQTPPVNGKRISSSFGTRAEAQQWLRRMQIQLEHGYDYQGGKISLAEYLSEWLNASRLSLRQKTIDQYERVIDKHIVPRIGEISLNELRLSKVEQYYAELLREGVGVRTVRVIHSILHRSFNKALQYDLVIKNPAHGAALPKYKQTEMKFLDESQVNTFLVAAHGSPYEALYYLAITTGMREGELFGLQWSDLHWNTCMLHVQRQSQRVAGKGWWFEEPKTRSGKRLIRLGESTLQKLREHHEQQELQKAVAGNRWKGYDLVFPNSVGKPGDPSNLRKDFLTILEKVGLPKIRFHDLRHTAASLMLNRNLPPIVVSKRLGHAKPSTTLDIYGHLLPEGQEEAARVMDEIITPIAVTLPIGNEVVKDSPSTLESSAPICTTSAPLRKKPTQ